MWSKQEINFALLSVWRHSRGALRRSFSLQQLKNKIRQLFLQKAPSQTFDWALKTPLHSMTDILKQALADALEII